MNRHLGMVLAIASLAGRAPTTRYAYFGPGPANDLWIGALDGTTNTGEIDHFGF